MCPPGDKETTDFTLHDMVILFIEEEVEEEVEVEEGESGFRKGKWIDLMEDLAEDMVKENNVRAQQQAPTDRLQLARQEDEWSLPPNVERRDDTERQQTPQVSPLSCPSSYREKDYLPTGVVKTLQEKE